MNDQIDKVIAPHLEQDSTTDASTISPDTLDVLDTNDTDDLDDDLDDGLDDDLNDETIKVPEEQLTEAEEIDKKLKGLDKEELTKEEKRARLRRQIAEKRNQRGTGGRTVVASRANNPHKQLAQAMNMPGMKDMMDTIAKGDNLEKLLRSTGTNGLDAGKMRQALAMARKS